MSIGPLSSVPGSVAGQSLAQTTGSDVERASQETAHQQRQIASGRKAEAAAGVGTTDTDGQQTNDRDADGRLAWERPARQQSPNQHESEPEQAPDPSGQSGSGLDITA